MTRSIPIWRNLKSNTMYHSFIHSLICNAAARPAHNRNSISIAECIIHQTFRIDNQKRILMEMLIMYV